MNRVDIVEMALVRLIGIGVLVEVFIFAVYLLVESLG